MAERDDRGDLPDDELDARWAALVADLEGIDPRTEQEPNDDPSKATDGPLDGTDATTQAGQRPPAVTYPVAPWVRTAQGPPADGDGPAGPVGPRDWDELEDGPESRFVPPDPGPISSGDPLVALAWVAVLVPLALALVVAIFWRSAPTAVLQAAGVVLLGGLAVLVWRMPSQRRIDSGPSDGAQV